MLHKKSQFTVKDRRSITEFFDRVQEPFERKFDGFPASVAPVGATPAVREGAAEGIDYGELDISDYLSDLTPQCVDVPLDEVDASGQSVVVELTLGAAGTYEAPSAVDYFVTVWVNGLQAVFGVDYTIVGDTISLLTAADANSVISARYVVA